MARRLRLTPKARSDLREIWTYVAQDNAAAAERVLERINEVFRMLVDQPEAGRRRDELTDGLRSFATRTHVVFYEVRENSVDVIRVLDGHRDIGEGMFDE
ncbi:type II toxin-antitoxin system RelE/ParE family toxin [Aminobacter sp. HY435]|uniref:type II toxin-antitoxin system RelE/ParE family toxin n=1 Tax=Aminobacter sp. HY435 TaxID=2970917 RepID=UPI0022B9467A|nr:type II toxin-antitoxin system RelE/ParE family toxin [Aminobacter sp. HY435]